MLSVPGAGDGRDEPVRSHPACPTYTRRGEPAHLTPDVPRRSPEARAPGVDGTSWITCRPRTSPTAPGGARTSAAPTFALATARDAITFDAHAKPSNDASSVFVGTPVGVKKISVDEYMRWARHAAARVRVAGGRAAQRRGRAGQETRAAAERTEADGDGAAMNDAREKVTNEEKETNVSHRDVRLRAGRVRRGGSARERVPRRRSRRWRGTTKDADALGFSVGGLGTSEARARRGARWWRRASPSSRDTNQCTWRASARRSRRSP